MRETRVITHQAEWARDLFAILAATAAGVHQALVGNWIAVGVSVAAVAAAITLWRTFPEQSVRTTPPLLLLLGVLLVWGFRESLLWLSSGGAVALVAAIDLDRLVRRFPTASPLSAQRTLLHRHLFHLLVLALATAIITLATVTITLRLQLVAVMFLAAFVVLAFVRILRQMGQGE